MSWTRTLDDDPVTQSRTLAHFDSTDGSYTNIEIQDVGAIADLADEHRKNEPSWRPWRGDTHLVGVIPNVVYWDLWKKGMLPSQDLPAFKRWWDDPQNPWRTKSGRL